MAMCTGIIYSLFLLFVGNFFPVSTQTPSNLASNRSFVIDYANDGFLKNEKPFRYISGSVHYFKTPRQYWRDRLSKLRAIGCNTVQTYIWWAMHEPREKIYDFKGHKNLFKFLQIADELGLLVILRIGPYVNDAIDMGGMPAWLLKHPNIFLRTADPNFMLAVRRWFGVLLPKLRPFLYANGGPVIMVQLENEYGSYFHHDRNYTKALLEIAKSYFGENVVYFTTDGDARGYLVGGVIPGVYPTVDFSPSSNKSVIEAAFKSQREFAPHGPLVNSEFYTGHFFLWHAHHRTWPTEPIVDTIEFMWHMNASFNFFMMYGGTHWGYQAGAEYFNNKYNSATTSFDYDAPITEAGDVTPKFLAIRKTLEALNGRKNPYPIPKPVKKRAYGPVHVKPIGTVIELINTLAPPEKVRFSQYPLSMEKIDFYFGFVLYQTVLRTNGQLLNLTAVHDRGYVYINKKLIGIVQRSNVTHLVHRFKAGSTLQILLENQGRICFGPFQNDSKGLVQNVTLDGKVLTKWKIYPIDLKNALTTNFTVSRNPQYSTQAQPTVFSGKFYPNVLADTFLNPEGWGKGVAFVNGYNLGRYWPSAGPQITLYVPKPFLKPVSKLVVLELEPSAYCVNHGNNCTFTFVDKPMHQNRHHLDEEL